MGQQQRHDRKGENAGLRLRRSIRGYAEFEVLVTFFKILRDVFTKRKTWPPEPKTIVDAASSTRCMPETPDHDTGPSLARGLYRLTVLFGCIAFIAFFFWNAYSTSASINRLSAVAKTFPYIETCDGNGNLIDAGQPNCVDLPNYLFINGPVLKAFRKACPGGNEPAEMLVLEKGKAPRIDIVRVEKSLSFRVRNKSPMPCYPHRRRS